MNVVVVIRHAEAPPNSTTTQSNWPTAHQFFSRPFMMGLRSCETLVLVDRQSVTAERKPKALDENPPSSSSTAKEFPPVVVLVRRHCHPSSAPPAGSFQEVSLRLENAPRKLHGNFRRRQSSLSLQERNFVEAPKSLSICLFFRRFQPIVPVSVPIRESDMSYTKQTLGISDPHIYGALRLQRAGSGCRCYISANFERSVTF